MPEHMRTPDCLADEGFAIIIGGTETTTRSLGLGAYHLIGNENIRLKLREELRSVMPTPESKPSWNQLEQLPYLVCGLYFSSEVLFCSLNSRQGFFLETLRISTGVASRSARVAPTETLIYKDYVIPPGVSKLYNQHL